MNAVLALSADRQNAVVTSLIDLLLDVHDVLRRKPEELEPDWLRPLWLF